MKLNWKKDYYKSRLILDWFYKTTNAGDVLNDWLITRISGKQVSSVETNYDFTGTPVYACIGSILQKKFKYKTDIWGAGAMYPDRPVYNVGKVHAVRGPFSRSVLTAQGIDCPEVYGDPAILLPLFYTPRDNKKRYSVGILPHYIDQDTEWIKSRSKSEDVKIIDILNPVDQVIDEITSCLCVVSSSLHGLIIADAYSVSSLWVEFSDKVRGNGFKFRDYYAGIGYNPPEPFQLRDNKLSLYDVQRQAKRITIKDETQQALLKVCPFYKEVTI